MPTSIAAKIQTTIPKKIREQRKLVVMTSSHGRSREGIILKPQHADFLLRKNTRNAAAANLARKFATEHAAAGRAVVY